MTGAPKKAAEDLRKNRSIKFSDNEWNRIIKYAGAVGVKPAAYIRYKSLENK